MAPLVKVSLINGSRETENASGPYSMLFIDPHKELHQKQLVTQRNDITKKLHQNLKDTFNNFTQIIADNVRNIKQPQDTKKRSSELDIKSDNNQEPKKLNLELFPVNKSCENLPKYSTIEVKRRRTSNPKIQTQVLRSLSDSIEKPITLPQLNFLSNKLGLNASTPSKNDANSSLRNSRLSLIKPEENFNVRILNIKQESITNEDDSSKRDSLEFDESLGILTPDEMCTQFLNSQTRSPSFEYDKSITDYLTVKKLEIDSPKDDSLGLIDESLLNLTMNKSKAIKDELQSPNLTDYSLGIIDENILSNLTMKTDTTVNMELPLDLEKTVLTRMEQTPSPEELPLDPTPQVESDPKTEPSKSKNSNSFINSITSITSLDTGYQGDGEMSRPASRGADNSPLTRRPTARAQSRRIDPMTDSDFYTESDADNHEDNPLRGDRRAQVIDGTLYGVDPQAAADIYVNNRENMDSSGIFTDIESNTRNDDDFNNLVPDISPSDTSSKTISENSQNNINQIIEKTIEKKIDDGIVQKDNPKKRNAPSPGISSPSSFSSPRHTSKDDSTGSAKKYKMPKREVPSKVKAMMEPVGDQNAEKKLVKKSVGRWDAVMSKISKNEQNKTNLKEVKSKVFSSVNVNTGVPQRKVVTRNTGNQKNPNSKLRRIRNRPNSGPSPKTIAGSNLESSIHSSLSDVSAATLPPTSKKIGSAKKRADVVQVTQVLTANKLPPRSQQTAAENKKNTTLNSSPTDAKVKRTLFPPKEKKPTAIKECTRGTVKGGRASPTVRPPAQVRAPVKQPPVAEALAVLVQHLVFDVQAYQVPTLKRQAEKFRLEAEKFKSVCKQLEEALVQEKNQHSRNLEDERLRCLQLVEKHMNEISELNQHYAGIEQRFIADKDNTRQNLSRQHEDQLNALKKDFEESLDILREENEAIREQIDEKNAEIERARYESKKLKEDYETKETILKEHNHKLKQQLSKLEENFEDRLKGLVDENKRFREENDRLLSYGDEKGISMQEVQSLRAVLELKQNEVSELRRSLAEAIQRADVLVGAEEKARVLNARCEDLQLQLERKSDMEKSLQQENMKLHESFKEETNQKRRLSQYNEELQWKLKQNKEVINKVLEQAEETVFNRKMMSASFNERHNATRITLERAMSFRERSYSNRSSNNGDDKSRKSFSSTFDNGDDISPPTSPKVKGIVEKSDSVSYVLEMNESPDEVASRIVRRSFRNSTPAKTTPTKSPSNKRPRIRNPLSQSSSTSAILNAPKTDLERPRSANSRNGDSDNDSVFHWTNVKYDERQDESYESSGSSMKLEDHDHLDLDEDNLDDLRLPALPSELDRRNGAAQALPSPKHLAGEAMISESNSEDESTSSSQL
ncbi:unnamed protein product [Psylliodes chrysocephalus]|uniref:Uncharacterized protein n=1 Tax=Psylliodes chrysocephalus TaxID=3402493 RepID=A0A9P0D2I5_9CUCU|nr:unnamed protein product [Psylliodes chrysocephala]